MRALSLLSLGLGIQLLLGGCAVGNTYNYQNSELSLPIVGNETISLGVLDNRTYVVSGAKSPDYVGVQRGGYGNPFDVTTATGKPLAEELGFSVQEALNRNGFSVIPLSVSSSESEAIISAVKQNDTRRSITLKINEWKTDAMLRLRLIYDLELSIFDKEGNSIAEAKDSGDEVISGAGFEKGNSNNASSSFETKIGRLFNTPLIRGAMER
jgi:hypothetical protein